MTFFDRDYFYRVWIIQEITRGNLINVTCGTQTLRWKVFAMGASLLNECIRHLGLWREQAEFIGLNNIHLSLASRHYLESLSLIDLLYSTSAFEATDPLDKVYAVLGCSLHYKPDRFPIDYRSSVPALHLRLGRMLYLEAEALHALSYAHYDEDVPTDVPSWLPNFNLMSMYTPIRLIRYGNAIYGRSVPPRVSVLDSTLTLFGRLVATVGSVSEPTSEKRNDGFWYSREDVLSRNINDLVLSLSSRSQPAAFRSLVSAATLGKRGVTQGDFKNDEDIDDHGRLFLSVLLLYSESGTVPSAPWYLRITEQHEKDGSQGTDARALDDVPDLGHASRKPIDGKSMRVEAALKTFDVPRRLVERSIYSLDAPMRQGCLRRRLFVLNGKPTAIGIGPAATRVGDIVVQLLGAETPFVFRAGADCYRCVGECYIRGEMPGDDPDFWDNVDVDKLGTFNLR